MSIIGNLWPERPECDFTPEMFRPHHHGNYDSRGRTQCAECSKVVLLKDALVIVKKTNGEDLVEHFCGEPCANEFYLERLRSSGL